MPVLGVAVPVVAEVVGVAVAVVVEVLGVAVAAAPEVAGVAVALLELELDVPLPPVTAIPLVAPKPHMTVLGRSIYWISP